MRAVFAILSLLTLSLAADASAQAAPSRKTPPPTVAKAPMPQATVPPPAMSPSSSPWKAILRVLPNPLPPGRCASASVEVQDPDGYRATTLSNGASIDFHQFVYQATDTSTLKWRDGAPVFGVICAPASATSARTTISVALPDGLGASVDLALLGPGQSASPVQYPAQGRLRPAGLAAAQTVATMAMQPSTSTASASAAVSANPPIGIAGADTGAQHRWPGTLTIDGATVPAQFMRGGNAVASVVATDIGAGGKHVGNISYEPIVLSVAPSAALASWINSGWSGAPSRKDGTVNAQLAAAFPSAAGHIAFSSAIISSTRVPELPVAARGDGLTISLSPEIITRSTDSKTVASTAPESISDFRFTISGLTTGSVSKIASFEVAEPSTADAVGALRESQRTAPQAVFPDIFVTIDERSATDWIAWYNSAMFDGHHLAADEKTFTLDLLGSKSSAVIAEIKGSGVGIVALRSNQVAGKPATLEAELYVTRMEFVAKDNK